jgi:hypothetical protein
VGTPTFLCSPSWPSCMDGGFSATGISFMPMDRVHGQLSCGAPCSPFCRHVVALPLRKRKEEARGAYKRRRHTTVAKDRILILA